MGRVAGSQRTWEFPRVTPVHRQPYLTAVDYLFRTNLEDIPALLRWVESCVESGCMTERIAAEWRARIDEWKEWLEAQRAS